MGMPSDPILACVTALSTFAFFRGRKCRGDVILFFTAIGYIGLAACYTLPSSNYDTTKFAFLRSSFLLAYFYVFLSAFFAAYRLSRFHPLSSLPGPVLNRMTELPLAISAYKCTRHTYLCRLHDEYGPVVRIAPFSVSINTRTAVHIIHSSAQCFNKSDAYDLHMQGEGLFFVKDRERHSVRRRPWNRALSSEAIPEYYEALFKVTHTFIDTALRYTWEQGSFDLATVVMHWAFDSMALITFGGNNFESSLLSDGDPSNVVEEARLTLAAFEFLGHVPWLFDILRHFPSSRFRRFEMFSVEQARRRLEATKLQFKDIFSYWLDDLEDGAAPVLEDLAVESEVAIIAGTETVGSMTALIFFFILSHPQWREAICHELMETFDDLHPLSVQSVDKLDDLPILNAVLLEGLRLGSVFSGVHRVVPPGGAYIEGYYFPEGVTMSVPIYAQHLQESNFGWDPAVFNPQRFLSDDFRADRTALLAFSSGPFSCVGYRLAQKQLKIIVACTFLQLSVETLPDFDPGKFWAGVGNLRATVIRESLTVAARRLNDTCGVIFPDA